VAVIDLHDFETKQIVVNPFFKSEHGAFVTPNTEYVMEATQYAHPLLDDGYVPLEEFNDKYRGDSPTGSSTRRRAVSSPRIPSSSSWVPTARTSRTRARGTAMSPSTASRRS